MELFVKLICFLNIIVVAFGQEIPEGENVIASDNVTNFGTWGLWDSCTDKKTVTAFQLKVEPKNSLIDDTGLNGIRLFCGRKPTTTTTTTVPPDTVVVNGSSEPIWENVTSSVGIFGYWGEVFSCRTYAIGFDLEVVPPRGNYRDDKGATNMKLICADGNRIEGFQDNGNEHKFDGAIYTGAQTCGTGYGLCGIQTQVEEYQVVGKHYQFEFRKLPIQYCILIVRS